MTPIPDSSNSYHPTVTLRLRRLALLGLIPLLTLAVLAPSKAHAADGDELDALGHALDNFYLDFSPFPKVELPRIFLMRGDDGKLFLDFYRSTGAMLASGRWVAESVPASVQVEGEPIIITDNEEALIPGAGEPPSDPGLTIIPEATPETPYVNYFYATLIPVSGTALVDFSISRHVVFSLLAMAILLGLFIPMAGRYRRGIGRTEAPRGVLQNMLETIVVYIRDEIARPNLGTKADRHLPYLLTIFCFILVLNLLGLVPFGASATGNITVTAVLAICTFIITQFSGSRDYWAHIFWPPGIPTPIKFILIPVEILAIFTKPFSLAVRLFANMTAGKLVILNLLGLIFVITALFGRIAGWSVVLPSLGLTLFIFVLKFLISFIQAYVFTMLSALFIGMAAAEHEHHHDEEHRPSLDHIPTS